jgi:hypothetical protein
MVVAHNPIYPITTIPNLSPCSDGAGVVFSVGESKWAGREEKMVVLWSNIGWKERDMEEGQVLNHR